LMINISTVKGKRTNAFSVNTDVKQGMGCYTFVHGFKIGWALTLCEAQSHRDLLVSWLFDCVRSHIHYCSRQRGTNNVVWRLGRRGADWRWDGMGSRGRTGTRSVPGTVPGSLLQRVGTWMVRSSQIQRMHDLKQNFFEHFE
jgi:hypothetical protein